MGIQQCGYCADTAIEPPGLSTQAAAALAISEAQWI